MATEESLVDKKLSIYDNADNDLIKEVGDVEKSILKKILSLLDKADTKGGALVNNDTALQLVNSLQKEILKIIKGSKFEDKVSEYLRNFDDMEGLTASLIKEVNGIDVDMKLLNTVKQQSVEYLTSQLNTPQSISNNLVQPVKKILFDSIVTGTTIDQARKILTDFIAGDKQKLGYMSRWVGQIARDSITQYDGLVNSVISKEYELNAYRYVGSLITDSRPQCVRWVGQEVLPFDDLQKEITWAKNNGKGMNPLTTPETFAVYRGGYNCRHMAIPFRSEEIAKDK